MKYRSIYRASWRLLLVTMCVALVGGCNFEGGRASESSLADQQLEVDCDDYTELRQPLFGDLHVHTSYSLDAAQLGNTVDPFGAYRYARGEPVEYRDNTIQIDRPLHFAGITDHSEFLAITNFKTVSRTTHTPTLIRVKGAL